jgi:hypothetical protein
MNRAVAVSMFGEFKIKAFIESPRPGHIRTAKHQQIDEAHRTSFGSLQTPPPVAWFSFAVGHGDHKPAAGRFLKNDKERKLPQHASAGPKQMRLKHQWSDFNCGKAAFQFFLKSLSNARITLFVIIVSLGRLLVSKRMNLDRFTCHRRISDRDFR